jgi:hypothetical protein
MPNLDFRRLPELTTRDLSFWLGEFERVHDGDPDAIIMRPEQHDAIENDWTTDTAVPVTGPELFIREELSDSYSRVGHFRSIPIELRE